MISQLIERSEGHDLLKQDYGPSSVRDWAFTTSKDRLALRDRSRRLRLPLTDHALSQVCGRLGAAVWPGGQRSLPLDYVKACPAFMQMSQLEYWRNRLPEEREWFVRTYQGEVRAVLTDRYSVVDCTQVLKWLEQIILEEGLTATYFKPYLTPDLLHLRVIFGNVKPGGGGQMANTHWGIGVYVSTGEIGNRRVEVAPMVQNNSCTNSIWMRHAGHWASTHTGDSYVLRGAFLVHLLEALEASGKLMERLLLAERQSLPKFKDVLDEMCKQYGWSQAIRDDVIRGAGTEQPTVYTMTMGLTYAAQKLHPEAQDEVEGIAGEFLHHMTKQLVHNAV